MNITLSVDEQVVARAREAAQKLGKSLNRWCVTTWSNWPAVPGAANSGSSLSSAVWNRKHGWRVGVLTVTKPTSVDLMSTKSFIDTHVLAGCSVLFSEDMNVGETMAGVRIVNPFA